MVWRIRHESALVRPLMNRLEGAQARRRSEMGKLLAVLAEQNLHVLLGPQLPGLAIKRL